MRDLSPKELDSIMAASKEAAYLLSKKHENIFKEPTMFVLFMQALMLNASICHLHVANFEVNEEIIKIVLDHLCDKTFFNESVQMVFISDDECSDLSKIPKSMLDELVEDPKAPKNLISGVRRELYKRSLNTKEES